MAAGAVANGFVCFGYMLMPLKMPLKWKAPRPEVGRFHPVCSLNSLRCVVAAKSSRSGTRLELPRYSASLVREKKHRGFAASLGVFWARGSDGAVPGMPA